MYVIMSSVIVYLPVGAGFKAVPRQTNRVHRVCGLAPPLFLDQRCMYVGEIFFGFVRDGALGGGGRTVKTRLLRFDEHMRVNNPSLSRYISKAQSSTRGCFPCLGCGASVRPSWVIYVNSCEGTDARAPLQALRFVCERLRMGLQNLGRCQEFSGFRFFDISASFASLGSVRQALF